MTEVAAGRPQAHSHDVNRWLVLVLVCMAQFMVILDATIVNVALPSIQEDLDMSEADLQWIIRKGVVAACDLPAGTHLEAHHLMYARPATAFRSGELTALVGKVTLQEVRAGELIRRGGVGSAWR